MARTTKKTFTPAELKKYAHSLQQSRAGIDAIRNEVDRAMSEGNEIDHGLVGKVVVALLEKGEQGVDSINRGIYEMKQKIENLRHEEELISQLRRMAEAQLKGVQKTVTKAIDDIFEGKEDVPHRLEGDLFSVWTQPNGKKSLVIYEEEAIPHEYRRYQIIINVQANNKGVKMYDAIESFLSGTTDAKTSIRKTEPVISNTWVTEAIESGVDVPGARIEEGRHLRMTTLAKIEATLKQIESAQDEVVDVEGGDS